ncbi:MAG TPA: TonB-dependent receptor [Polyangia bacterium]|nr:TonB-dependent receptor [Polyangia bacterium]
MTAGLFLARSAQAQQGEGTLTGTVTDAATKAPVADVVVTATSPNLQGEQVVVTDSSGFYRIPTLPPGAYTLRFDKEAYKPLARDGISLRSDTTIRLNAELLPEALQAEEVVVVARAPTVDVGSSSTGATLNSEFTRRVPVSAPGGKGSASRSFESVASAAAGAADDNSGFGTSINGASAAENSFIIDGLSTNNPGFGISGTPLSSEFVGEINVVTGGYLPEYGRSTGGVISAVTKSGTNDFHGGAYFNYSPGALEGTRHAVPREGQSVLFQPKLNYEGDVGFDLGGPLVKDKLWFYVGLNISQTSYDIRRSVNRIQTDAAGNPIMKNGFTQTEEVPGNTTHNDAILQTEQAFGKLTYAANPSNRFVATFSALPSSSGASNQYGINPRDGQPEVSTDSNGGTLQSMAHRFSSNPYDATLRWTTESPKKNVTVETLLGWHHQSETLLPSDGSQINSSNPNALANIPTIQWINAGHNLPDLDPTLRNQGMCIGGGATTVLCPVSPQYNSNGPGEQDAQKYDRYQVGSTLTFLAQGLGHHIAKAGFSLEFTDYSHTKSYSGGRQYLENDDGTIGDQFRFGVLTAPDTPLGLDGRTLKTQSLIVGGFIQDSWSIVDKFTVNLGVRYDTQALYADGGQLGLVLPNQWSPRLGAIYDPTQSGRSKIFINYAKYYENVPLDLADVALSGEPHTLANYSSNCGPAQIVASPKGCLTESVAQVQGNATNPNQKYVAFGAGASPIDPNLKPQSQHEVVAGADYEIMSDLRASLTYTKRWMGDVVEDMSRDGLQTFFLGNPGEGVASDFAKAKRDYDAFTLQFVKNFRDNWLLNASYTLSWLRGNIGGLISQDGALIPNHTADFDTKGLTINRDGYLPNDQRHSIKIFGAKEWVVAARHHISTGIAIRAHSGQPTTPLGADPDYGLGFAFIQQRGTGPRVPWDYSADLQAGYTLYLNKNHALSVEINVFNFLNLQNITETEENYTTQNVCFSATGAGGSCAIPQKGVKLTPVYADGAMMGAVDVKTPGDVQNYGKPTAYSNPRTFRFGARWTF